MSNPITNRKKAPAPEILAEVMAHLGRIGGSRKVPKGFATMSKRRSRQIQAAGRKAKAEKKASREGAAG